MLNRDTLCRWKNTVAPLYRLPTLPGALLWINCVPVRCASRSLSLSLSLSPSLPFSLFFVSLYVSAHFVQLSFCRISTAGHARHAAADPRDICPDQSGTRYSRSEGLANRAGGVINHRPLCSVERENIVPGGTATWRILLFFSLLRRPPLAINPFFEPLLLGETCPRSGHSLLSVLFINYNFVRICRKTRRREYQ